MYTFYGNYYVYLCVYIVMSDYLCVYIVMRDYLCVYILMGDYLCVYILKACKKTNNYIFVCMIPFFWS